MKLLVLCLSLLFASSCSEVSRIPSQVKKYFTEGGLIFEEGPDLSKEKTGQRGQGSSGEYDLRHEVGDELGDELDISNERPSRLKDFGHAKKMSNLKLRIAQTLLANKDKFRSCDKNKRERGKVPVYFELLKNGKVQRVGIQESSLSMPLKACLVEIIYAIRFPSLPLGVDKINVRQPLVF